MSSVLTPTHVHLGDEEGGDGLQLEGVFDWDESDSPEFESDRAISFRVAEGAVQQQTAGNRRRTGWVATSPAIAAEDVAFWGSEESAEAQIARMQAAPRTVGASISSTSGVLRRRLSRGASAGAIGKASAGDNPGATKLKPGRLKRFKSMGRTNDSE